ncbi:hypothetical protein CFR79_14580 [Komagataeibacter saccharivorans]|uniref:hypothetical protein n=1 Tax=Komagataeibacter saccharivorans TaxID=265959 RepID=UPI000D7C2BEC|nr:hypothetical protein [Komagataeibacter saccharivorans]PYD49460.1 hypothetical protein CFR79_14580 [Komagataeibacter saccharivorans]GBQ42114.1 hypothetical protein AA0614_2547 [Komagataeibacter saccharivorans NRIC 0614]
MDLSSIKLDDTLKAVQIAFYVVGTSVAVLTYRAARRGLLNTVATEYQKRVMDRLQQLSEDLFSEFDDASLTHWSRTNPVHDTIKEINEIFIDDDLVDLKEEIFAARRYDYGIPILPNVLRLMHMLKPITSDPFIPRNIKAAVVDLIENRINVMQSIYNTEFERYTDRLAKRKQKPLTKLDDINKFHNRIIDQLNQQGCGIRSIEVDTHNIRAMIQDYFESFNPHRRWWHRIFAAERRLEHNQE